MLYFVWLILVISGLVLKKKSYTIGRFKFYSDDIWGVLSVAFIVYIAYQGIERPDYANYNLAYDSLVSDAQVTTLSGTLYDGLCRFVGNYFALEFRAFQAILILISFFIAWRIVKRYTANTGLVFSLILIYPLFLQIVQFRNTFSTAFLWVALEFYIRDKKRDKILFLLLLIISASLHSVNYYFFLLCLFWFGKGIKKYYKKLILLAVVALFLLRAPLIILMKQFVSAVRYTHYLTEIQTGILGFCIYTVAYIINLKIAEGEYKYASINPHVFDLKELKLLKANYQLRLLALLSLPLVALTPDFLRISREIYLYSYICAALFLEGGVQTVKLRFNKYAVSINLLWFTIIYAVLHWLFVVYSTPRVFVKVLGG